MQKWIENVIRIHYASVELSMKFFNRVTSNNHFLPRCRNWSLMNDTIIYKVVVNLATSLGSLIVCSFSLYELHNVKWKVNHCMNFMIVRLFSPVCQKYQRHLALGNYATSGQTFCTRVLWARVSVLKSITMEV